MATGYEVLQTIDQVLAEEAARYGIQNPMAFADALLGVITSENAGYNPTLRHPTGEYGLFGFHQSWHEKRFREAYPGREADIEAQVRYALTYLAPVWADSERQGQNPEQGLRRLIAEGQRPAEEYVEQGFQNALAAVRQFGRAAGAVAGAAGQAGLGGFQEVAPTAGQGAEAQEVISWWASFFQDEPGYTAMQKAEDLFYDDPFKAISTWREMTGDEAGVTEAEKARTAYDWALANKLIVELGGNTYEQGRQRILDQMDEKQWDATHAISEFNAWMSAALEAGKRAETVYGEEMKRKVWTTPTEHYLGTEPGGINQQMYERYGLEYKPSPGISVETLPNQEQMYGQWHQNLGISQQAPATQGGWSGQGTGLNAAMDFLQRMNLRPGVRQGAGI